MITLTARYVSKLTTWFVLQKQRQQQPPNLDLGLDFLDVILHPPGRGYRSRAPEIRRGPGDIKVPSLVAGEPPIPLLAIAEEGAVSVDENVPAAANSVAIAPVGVGDWIIIGGVRK